jgi:hypothetical protein
MKTTNEPAGNDAPQAISPDARPPTHDESDSARVDGQPYAAEIEDYEADHINTPEDPDREKKRKRGES